MIILIIYAACSSSQAYQKATVSWYLSWPSSSLKSKSKRLICSRHVSSSTPQSVLPPSAPHPGRSCCRGWGVGCPAKSASPVVRVDCVWLHPSSQDRRYQRQRLLHRLSGNIFPNCPWISPVHQDPKHWYSLCLYELFYSWSLSSVLCLHQTHP